MENASAKSEVQIERAPKVENSTVEIAVCERTWDALEAGEREGVAVAATRGPIGRLLVLAAVLVIAALYVGPLIGSGWVPADDGTLSQSALRVLEGQLPHGDFG